VFFAAVVLLFGVLGRIAKARRKAGELSLMQTLVLFSALVLATTLGFGFAGEGWSFGWAALFGAIAGEHLLPQRGPGVAHVPGLPADVPADLRDALWRLRPGAAAHDSHRHRPVRDALLHPVQQRLRVLVQLLGELQRLAREPRRRRSLQLDPPQLVVLRLVERLELVVARLVVLVVLALVGRRVLGGGGSFGGGGASSSW
jgi:hypothetical protein